PLRGEVRQLGAGRATVPGARPPRESPGAADASGRLGGGPDPVSGCVLMRAGGLTADLIANDPGRSARALEISVACAMAVIVSMTFQIPDPAISAYLIFFAAKDNSALNIVMSIALIVVITIVVALSFGLTL